MVTDSGNANGKIRVAYFDDQSLFREALVAVLEDSGTVTVVHDSGHGGLEIHALMQKSVHALLIALDGQTGDPMVTLRQGQHITPKSPMCALVSNERLERAREAIAFGCKGVISTAASLGMLVAALKDLAGGMAFVDPSLAGRLLATAAASPRFKNGLTCTKTMRRKDGPLG